MPFGHGVIYPNMYAMLVGVPGTRKSSAIRLSKRLLADSGYGYFSYAKTTKQKFLLDLEEGTIPRDKSGKVDFSQVLEMDLQAETRDTADNFICCDEFVDFIGINNIEFINLLTTLWDNLDDYDERLKNSKSVRILKPTINLLGGITPTSFAQAMPPEVAGQGFLSRIIMVYGEPPAKRITWPRIPAAEEYKVFTECFSRVGKLQGEVILTESAKITIDTIYQNWENLDDSRLQYYGARRLTHLLKLCITLAALRASTEEVLIHDDIVVEANTILTYTELNMHNALGEFGKAKNSDASHKVVEVLSQSKGPLSAEELWKAVSNDLDKYQSLIEILGNLVRAQRITMRQDGDGKTVVMLKKKQARDVKGITDFKRFIREYESKHELFAVKSVGNDSVE